MIGQTGRTRPGTDRRRRHSLGLNDEVIVDGRGCEYSAGNHLRDRNCSLQLLLLPAEAAVRGYVLRRDLNRIRGWVAVLLDLDIEKVGPIRFWCASALSGRSGSKAAARKRPNGCERV